MKARFRIISTKWGRTLWAPSRRRYTSRRYKLYGCACTYVYVHACPNGLKCVILDELEHPTGGRNSFLVSSRADECVSLVVTCLGNITEIQLLPRYTDVAHDIICNFTLRPTLSSFASCVSLTTAFSCIVAIFLN